MFRTTTLAAVAAAVLAVLLLPGLASSSLGAPAQRIDLKVLLIGGSGDSPALRAWQTALSQEGVPYDSVTVGSGAISATRLYDAAANRAYYQGVVIAGSGVDAQLSASERDALVNFRTTFGIRQVDAYVYPSAQYGLNTPASGGSMQGVTGSLTAAGKASFPYLKGSVPFDGLAYGYQATPCATCAGAFTTFLTGPGGSALLGVSTATNGLEDLVSTVDANSSMIHNQLLRHGMLSWVTKGVYLGMNRAYLGLHVDDIFIGDDRWNVTENCTPEPGVTCSPTPEIHMTANDVTRARNWMSQKGVKFSFLFNASESSPSDPLTKELLANKKEFDWINHTWSHLNLNGASVATIDSEIQQNLDWAKQNRIPINKTELVTGEHSGLSDPFTGLSNPNMVQAVKDTGVRALGSDASRQPDQYAIGQALTVPRWPTNVYYNAATKAEELDEYNYIYLPPELGGSCTNTSVTTCRTSPIGWDEYTDLEATIMFRHVMANDPRPHYFHEANLAEDGILYDVVGKLVDRYKTYISAPLVQPAFAEASTLLSQRKRWNDALAGGRVAAYAQDGRVVVSTSTTLDVPVTGTTSGTAYAGETSGWVTVTSAGASLPLASRTDPSATAVPSVSGTAQEGQQLQATTGTWSGATPQTYRYQWQRCTGSACVNVPDATASSYTLTAADLGSSVRVVVTAANSAGSGPAISSSTALIVAAPKPPVNTVAPTISGDGQVGSTLTANPGTWTGDPTPTLAYQWQRYALDAQGVWDWRPIAAATGQTYVVTNDDAWKLLRVLVTGTNTGGSTSAGSSTIQAGPPTA